MWGNTFLKENKIESNSPGVYIMRNSSLRINHFLQPCSILFYVFKSIYTINSRRSGRNNHQSNFFCLMLQITMKLSNQQVLKFQVHASHKQTCASWPEALYILHSCQPARLFQMEKTGGKLDLPSSCLLWVSCLKARLQAKLCNLTVQFLPSMAKIGEILYNSKVVQINVWTNKNSAFWVS